MAEAETYDVLAIRYGSHTNRTLRENFMMAGDDHAAPYPIDYFVWVIRNARRTILVDTGFDRTEAKGRGRTIEAEPREILGRLGIDAATLTDVVISHLHYDHAGTLDHFPAARFHIQEAEVAYATGRCMCDEILRRPFTAEHICQVVRKIYSGRVQFHEGDGAIAPGITVHKVAGHSKGQQCVRVLTKTGWVVLAVDSAHTYDNFELRRPFPIVVDVEATLRSYDKLEALATSRRHIIPGHDPLVMKRYPPLSEQMAGVVHRLDVARLD